MTHQLNHAQQLYEDLLEFSEAKDVFLYPVNELLASELAIASPELLSQRMDALNAWIQADKGILIAPVAGLKRMLPPPEYWNKYQIKVELTKTLDIEEVLQKLIEMGYVRQEMTSSPGEFSLRGGILDVYPITDEDPIRIELFDDEVDSIRFFDAETQRSLKKLDQVTIGPATELLATDEDLVTAAQRIEHALQQTLKKTKK